MNPLGDIISLGWLDKLYLVIASSDIRLYCDKKDPST
jgi:hypothetical protein